MVNGRKKQRVTLCSTPLLYVVITYGSLEMETSSDNTKKEITGLALKWEASLSTTFAHTYVQKEIIIKEGIGSSMN